jgi:hypothetical protein
MQNGHRKREDVGDNEEVDLGPHELMLRVPTPFDKNAVLTGSAKLASAQDVQLIVTGAKAPPDDSNCCSPHNQEDLESEVQDHTWSTHGRDAQIGPERIEFAGDVAHLFFATLSIVNLFKFFSGGMQLHVGPVGVTTHQCRIIEVASSAKINHCRESKQAHAREKANDDVQRDNVGSLTLAIWSDGEEHDALFACVRAIQNVFVAIFNHGASACVMSIDNIWDRAICISGGALRPRNTNKGAPSIPSVWELVMQILRIVRALRRALLVL